MDKPKKYQVVSIGGATRDILFYSGEGELVSTNNLTKQKLLAFEYGAKILADKIYFAFGGGAANSAVSLSRLGIKAATICRVGDDENGRMVVENLKSSNVDVSLIPAKSKAATGFSMILTTKNAAREHIAFLYRGANEELSVRDVPIAKFSTDWFYVTSLPRVGWEMVMSSLVKTGSKIFWNPGGAQLKDLAKIKKLLPKIEILMLNRDEAAEFKKLKNIKSLLSDIQKLGTKLVIITDGDKGAYAYDGKKYYYMKAKSTKPVNTVGVGDSFGSAFLAAIISKSTVKGALAWGMKNSASVVSQIGAQDGLLTRGRILR